MTPERWEVGSAFPFVAPGRSSHTGLHESLEKKFTRSTPARISAFSRDLIGYFPVHEWRSQRLRSIDYPPTPVYAIRKLTVWLSKPCTVVLFENHDQREKACPRLLQARNYPAILWPTDNVDALPDDRDFSQQMLFVHADFRWGERGMHRVTEQVAACLDQQRSVRDGQPDR